MHATVGLIREKLGKTVNKVMLMRCVGTIKMQVPIRTETGDFETKDGKFATEERTLKKYRMVAAKYFGANELFWQYDKTHAYELRLENEAYGRGETHVQFLDFDTGDSINLNGAVIMGNQPSKLSKAIAVEHLQTFGASVKPMAGSLAIILLTAGFCILIGFFIGSNSGAIANALHLGASAPVPTLTPAPTYPPIIGGIPYQ